MTLAQHYHCCTLCPRRCSVDREMQRGHCGMPNMPTVIRVAAHHWEEPCISGTQGAGAVFFSGCALHCVFCQNSDISQGHKGTALSPEKLRALFLSLIAQGVHNLDLVTPSHFAHVLAQVLQPPLPVPVVWNSSAYELPEVLRALEGCVQVYLPDFKYLRPESARSYSAAADYPQVAKAAITEMVRQTGPVQLGEDGLLQRGVLIRHLLLPGGLAEAKEIMDWIAESFPPDTVLFSLMSQYTPMSRALQIAPLDRRLRASERRAAAAYMDALGLAGYRQGEDAADARFTPAFDGTGL